MENLAGELTVRHYSLLWHFGCELVRSMVWRCFSAGVYGKRLAASSVWLRAFQSRAKNV